MRCEQQNIKEKKNLIKYKQDNNRFTWFTQN